VNGKIKSFGDGSAFLFKKNSHKKCSKIKTQDIKVASNKRMLPLYSKIRNRHHSAMGKPQKSVSFVPDYTSAGCLFYDYLPHSGFVQQAIIKFLDIYTKCYRLLMQFQPDKIIFSLILSLIADLGNSKTVILLSCRDQNFVTICNYCF
jgi:hypothetical protein